MVNGTRIHEARVVLVTRRSVAIGRSAAEAFGAEHDKRMFAEVGKEAWKPDNRADMPWSATIIKQNMETYEKRGFRLIDTARADRGGAVVTGYVRSVTQPGPQLTEPGEVPVDQRWETLERFLKAVVPEAEKVGVRLAMRPDHIPTLDGESNDRPGYETLGRLFAIGSSEAWSKPHAGIRR